MKFTTIIIVLITLPHISKAQNDSIIFKNGNVIVGELKSMDRGVVTVETDYSDSDFKITWEEISEIFSEQAYFITLIDGRRFNGSFRSDSANTVTIIHNYVGPIVTRIDDIVYFKSYETNFWERFTGSIDINVSFTKANNLRQLDFRTNLGYLASRWSTNAHYNIIRSTQDDVDPTRRTDGGISYKWFLPKDWFWPFNYSFLSNTEQLIDLRNNINSGIGKYIVHNNDAYFGVETGIAYINEKFTNNEKNRNSMEAYVGSELNLYDIGELNLLTRGVFYPSITESGRIRVDYSLDTKYDLPKDFYIKVGFTLNYDNQPVEGATSNDYVIQTGFGWEL